MAGPPELFNFVNKFLNLLNCGQSARLTVESQGGKATVNLQLDLGPCLPPSHAEAQQGRPQRRAGPARLRRRAAHAQAREQAAAEAAPADVAVQAAISSPSIADTAVQAVVKPVPITKNIGVQCTSWP